MDIHSVLIKLGLRNVAKMGRSFKFSCPFHRNDGTQTAVLNPVKEIFKCFSCGEGYKQHIFFAKMSLGDLGYIDHTEDLDKFEVINFDSFYEAAKNKTIEYGQSLFNHGMPISMAPKYIQDYLEERLGENHFIPIECRYLTPASKTSTFPGCPESIMFYDGCMYSQKVLNGRYLNFGPNKMLTHVEHSDALVLVEGVFDYLCVAQLNVPVAATLGLAITPEKLTQLLEIGVEVVVLALDNDPAGLSAEKYMADLFISKGLKVKKSMKFDDVKDFGDMSYADIALSLNNASDIMDTYIEQLDNLSGFF